MPSASIKQRAPPLSSARPVTTANIDVLEVVFFKAILSDMMIVNVLRLFLRKEDEIRLCCCRQVKENSWDCCFLRDVVTKRFWPDQCEWLRKLKGRGRYIPDFESWLEAIDKPVSHGHGCHPRGRNGRGCHTCRS